MVRPSGTASAAPYIFWFSAAARRPRASRPSRARDRLCGANTSRPSRSSAAARLHDDPVDGVPGQPAPLVAEPDPDAEVVGDEQRGAGVDEVAR